MTGRAAFAGCLLLALASPVLARQAEATHAEGAKVTRAKLNASRGQVQSEGQQVKTLKARVDALEAESSSASQSLDERDRKIAELQRQLDARQKP
ncbi:DUF3450 domain-containing protein [Luteibacter sahnii]|uniref:hypothetical protein n=1 Tax=Luteibacter sahnii TaxID=3021977 RepID=UPI002A74B35D|nr:hypothetical protein [Luteibacter sp. PPL193]MDY1550074.1 hypothetical protein [Luteibacter sp. PPL193]